MNTNCINTITYGSVGKKVNQSLYPRLTKWCSCQNIVSPIPIIHPSTNLMRYTQAYLTLAQAATKTAIARPCAAAIWINVEFSP